MFQNRNTAEEQAKKAVSKEAHKFPTPEAAGRAGKKLADRLEKQHDDWTSKNVGLD